MESALLSTCRKNTKSNDNQLIEQFAGLVLTLAIQSDMFGGASLGLPRPKRRFILAMIENLEGIRKENITTELHRYSILRWFDELSKRLKV